MGKYRKISIRMWSDAKFRKLSSAQPNAQTLFIYLLTGKETGPIPGLFEASEVGLADRLKWSRESFRESFRELFEAGLVEADFDAGLVWIPKAIFHNKPQNPNIVSSWKEYWEDLPECELKNKAYQQLKSFMESLPESFMESFMKSFALQEQEQEQKQEQPKLLKFKLKAIPKGMEENDITTSCDASKEDDSKSNSQPSSLKPKKRNPSFEKKKKRLAEAKEKAKGRKKNNSLPTPDLSPSKNELFATDEANRQTMLTILGSKKKAFTQKKKKLEADLHEEFLRVYCAEKYRETGNGLPPDGKHIQPACIKLAKYCLEQNIQPEKYIGYWIENNFTKLDFPTMTFLAGDKQIEAANIVFSKTNGKSRKNRKKQNEEYGHSFVGELDRGFRDALRSGGFDKALKMTDRELMTYQVAARHEKEQPGDLGMSDSMKEIVDYLVENFYN